MCYPNLRTINLSLGDGQPPRPCQFVQECLSTITSTQLSEVTLSVSGIIPDLEAPGLDLSSSDSLDTILYNLPGQYRPQHEGDKMLVKFTYVNQNLPETGNFLRRYRERGILRLSGGASVESYRG